MLAPNQLNASRTCLVPSIHQSKDLLYAATPPAAPALPASVGCGPMTALWRAVVAVGGQDKTRRSRVLGGDQDTADGYCAVPARTIHLVVEPGKPNANLLAERGTAYRSSMTPAGDLTASAADGSAPETFLSATRSSM